MAQAQRTDPHRPGAIIPAHYEGQFSFSLPSSTGGMPIPGFMWNCEYDKRPGKVTEFGFVPEGPLGAHDGTGRCCAVAYLEAHKAARHGNPGKCDVCGAHYVHGTMYLHSPSGEAVLMGHDCADKYGALYDATEAELARERTMYGMRLACTRKQNDDARAKFLSENAGLAEALATAPPSPAAYGPASILADLRSKFTQYLSLSPKQVALAMRLADEIRNPKPKAEEAPKAPAPISKERQVITGTIVHTKWQESDYGGSLKMLLLVDTPAGQWKAWGTVPSGIEYQNPAELKGRQVKINALVEVSRNDTSFAYLKRPTVYTEPKPRAKAPTKALRTGQP